MVKIKIKDAVFALCFIVVLIFAVYYYINYKTEEFASFNYKLLYESEITSNTSMNLKVLKSIKDEEIMQAINILEISLKNKIDLIDNLNIRSDSLDKNITKYKNKYCNEPCLVKIK